MTNVQDMLRAADPIRHESTPAQEERNRVRQSVLAAPLGSPASSVARPTSRRGFVTAVAVAAVGFAVVRPQIWPRGSATLQAAVRFEMRLAEDAAGPGLEEARVANTDRVIYLQQEAIANNDDIAHASLVDDGRGHFSVGVQFSDAGSQRMQRATAGHVGRPVAILVDGDVVMAPVLRGAIATSAEINGDYTRSEAERIMNGITLR
jgi:preprotein translocase subunit SecD